MTRSLPVHRAVNGRYYVRLPNGQTRFISDVQAQQLAIECDQILPPKPQRTWRAPSTRSRNQRTPEARERARPLRARLQRAPAGLDPARLRRDRARPQGRRIGDVRFFDMAKGSAYEVVAGPTRRTTSGSSTNDYKSGSPTSATSSAACSTASADGKRRRRRASPARRAPPLCHMSMSLCNIAPRWSAMSSARTATSASTSPLRAARCTTAPAS